MDSPSAATPTPKQSTPEWIVGVAVKLKTTLGEEIEGEVFSFDSITNCVVLQEGPGLGLVPPAPRKNFRILKANYIKEVQVVGPGSSGDASQELPAVNLNRIRSREEQAIATQRQRLGIGVTPEAQEVFNALARTLPCRWGINHEIIVFDDVRILSPYSIENLSGGTSASLERVRKVLEGRRKK